MADVEEAKALAPCPNCRANWRRTELTGEARHGGGYRVLCHDCGHEWDDLQAAHNVRETARRNDAKREALWAEMQRAQEQLAEMDALCGNCGCLVRWDQPHSPMNLGMCSLGPVVSGRSVDPTHSGGRGEATDGR